MTSKDAAADSSDLLSQAKPAAKSLHEKADDLPSGRPVADVAHSAADTLNSTANYIRRRSFPAMTRDVRNVVKDNPVPALVGAAALGFLLAKVLSSRD